MSSRVVIRWQTRWIMTVYLVDRSALALSGRVLAPLGATDLTVSTDQSFVLSYKVENQGVAGTVRIHRRYG